MNRRSMICAVVASMMVAISVGAEPLAPVGDGSHMDRMQVDAEPDLAPVGDGSHMDNMQVDMELIDLMFAGWGSLTVNADSSSRVVLDALSESVSKGVMGYRVGLFFGNSGMARTSAQGVVALCDSLYGDVVTTLSYDNPYFKVSAGYCTTLEEALQLLDRMQRSFPNAFLVNERIMPSNLVEVRHREVEWQRRKAIEEGTKMLRDSMAADPEVAQM